MSTDVNEEVLLKFLIREANKCKYEEIKFKIHCWDDKTRKPTIYTCDIKKNKPDGIEYIDYHIDLPNNNISRSISDQTNKKVNMDISNE